MKRFYVSVAEGTMKLYYETEDECRAAFPEAEIMICDDKSFLSFIKNIKNVVKTILFDYKGREIWVIATPYGEIRYRQFVDNNNSYINGCEYQINGYKLVEPILWTLTNPKDFYQNVLTPMLNQDTGWISPKEGKQRKIKKLKDKNGYRYFTDQEGNYYIINKYMLPTKKNNNSYEKYHDTEAILVKYGTGVNDKTEWFDSLSDFGIFWQTYKENANPCFGTVRYDIRKRANQLIDLNEEHSILCVGKCPRMGSTQNQQIRQWAYGLKGFVAEWDSLIPLLNELNILIMRGEDK